MTVAEFNKAMEFFEISYRRQLDINEKKVWFKILKNNKQKEFINAIEECIRTSRFVPTIAEIMQYIPKQSRYGDLNKFYDNYKE